MTHAIVGAGGVGGLLGAALAHAGDDVAMVVRLGTKAAYPEKSTSTAHSARSMKRSSGLKTCLSVMSCGSA